MPEKNKDKEAPDKDEKEDIQDEEPSTREKEKAGDDKKPQPVKKKSGKIKWIIVILIGVVLGASGIGYMFKPEVFTSLFKKKFDAPLIIDEEKLSEVDISPFFIPPGPTDKAIRIDLTVVWDGIASIRFKNNELSTRHMMSERFNKLAGQHPDLNIVKSDLENEIGSMLRSSLGVQNLIIRIKEIRYF